MNTRTAIGSAVFLTAVIIAAGVWYNTSINKKDVPEAFEYEDLSKWRSVDPELVTYEEKNPIQTGFSSLHGIVLDSKGMIYGAGDTGVKQFSPSGTLVQEWKTDVPAQCTAVDDSGILYIGLKTKILKYKGKDLIQSWGTKGAQQGEFSHITAVDVKESNLFAADAGNRCVHRFTADGDFINDIGKKDPDKGEVGLVIRNPHLDIVAALDNVIYIVNPGMHKVVAYSYNGDIISSWGKYGLEIDGFSGCCNPTNFMLTPDGFFITSEKNIPRVKIYDSKGVFREVVAPPGVFDEKCAGMDLGIDSQGQIYVTDPVKKEIRIFVKKKGDASDE